MVILKDGKENEIQAGLRPKVSERQSDVHITESLQL